MTCPIENKMWPSGDGSFLPLALSGKSISREPLYPGLYREEMPCLAFFRTTETPGCDVKRFKIFTTKSTGCYP